MAVAMKCWHKRSVSAAVMGEGWGWCPDCNAYFPPRIVAAGDHQPRLVPVGAMTPGKWVVPLRNGGVPSVGRALYELTCACGEFWGPGDYRTLLSHWRGHTMNDSVIQYDDDQVPTDVDLAWGWDEPRDARA